MLRYVICPIVNDPTDSSIYYPATQQPNLSAVVNSAAIIQTHQSGPNLGKPKYGFAFCVITTGNLSVVYQLSNTLVFPDYPLDAQMGAMDADARAALAQSGQAYNLDGNGLHLDFTNLDTDSYRSLIESIGRQFDPAFHLNSFSVPEVSA